MKDIVTKMKNYFNLECYWGSAKSGHLFSSKIITDQNSKTEHLEMRRALRRPTHEETKIKCHKDEKFIKSVTKIIAEIVKSGDKTEKKVLS